MPQLQKTAAASTLSAMKSNSNSNIRSNENHIRKGGVGNWRDWWTVRESEEYDKIYQEQMKDTRLDFDFGEGESGTSGI